MRYIATCIECHSICNILAVVIILRSSITAVKACLYICDRQLLSLFLIEAATFLPKQIHRFPVYMPYHQQRALMGQNQTHSCIQYNLCPVSALSIDRKLHIVCRITVAQTDSLEAVLCDICGTVRCCRIYTIWNSHAICIIPLL